MGILSSIFGTPAVIEKGLDLIDSMHTSTQEEIVAKTKAKTDLLAAYAPFKLAQRYLALMFTAVYLTSFALTVGMRLADMDVTAIADTADAYKLDLIMLTIVGFYFGGGAFEGVIRTVKKKADASG